VASNFWTGGQPTAPDVNMLKKAFGDVPEIGTIITYEQIENTINIEKAGERWYTILDAWKKYLKTVNIRLKTLRNTGYRVMDSHDRAEYCGATFNRGIKKFKEVAVVATATDVTTLSQEEIIELEHYQRTSMALISAGSTAAKATRQKLAELKGGKALPATT